MGEDEELADYQYKKIVASINQSMAVGEDGDLYIWGKANLFQNNVKILPYKQDLIKKYLYYKVIHITSGLNHASAILECQLNKLLPEKAELKGWAQQVIQEHQMKLEEKNETEDILRQSEKRYIKVSQFRQFYLNHKTLKYLKYSSEISDQMAIKPLNEFEKYFLKLTKKEKHLADQATEDSEIDCLAYFQLINTKRPQYITLIWGSTSSGRLGIDKHQFNLNKISGKSSTGQDKQTSQDNTQQSKTKMSSGVYQLPSNEIVNMVQMKEQFIKICCGHHHTIAISPIQKMYVWGMGSQGCLGTGGIDDIAYPHLLDLKDDVIEIASGAFHCLALTQSFRLYGWGVNNRGQLGIGNKENQLQPQSITYFEKKQLEPVKLYAGDQHSACITVSKELYTWGNGDYYRLGHGMLMDELEPKKVEVLQDVYVLDCSLGTVHTLCTTNEGFVYAWGSSKDGVLGIPTQQYKDIQLPQRVGQLNQSFKDSTFYQVAAGTSHSMALSEKGHLYTWGSNKSNLLGYKVPGSDVQTIPKKVEYYQDNAQQNTEKAVFYNEEYEKIPQVEDEENHIKTHLDIFFIAPLFQDTQANQAHTCNYKYATCGQKNTFFLDMSGRLYGCGSNDYGMLCKNPTKKQKFDQLMPKEPPGNFYECSYTPIIISFFQKTTIRFVSCSYNHAIAITSKGSAYCWGQNSSNQLGLGFASDFVYTPMQLQGPLEQKKLIQSVCGERFSGVLTNNGEVWTFGTSEHGVLGHEEKSYYVIMEPRMINDIQPIIYLACSNQTMMAIDDERRLMVWGNNQFGQLGISLQRDEDEQQDGMQQNGTAKNEQKTKLKAELKTLKNPINYIIYKPRVVQVRSLLGESAVDQVACGLFHSIVITTTQDLLSCGLTTYSGHGLLDHDDKNEDQDSFVDQFSQILALSTKKFKQVAAHEHHTLVYTTSGEIIGWGINSNYQIGIRPADEKPFKQKILDFHNSSSPYLLACGPQHSLLIGNDKRVKSWGCAVGGRLGCKYTALLASNDDNAANLNDNLKSPAQFIICYQCETKPAAGENADKAGGDRSKSAKKGGSKKRSKKGKKGKDNNEIDVSFEEEDVLDETSFYSQDDGDGNHKVMDPLQKAIIRQPQECEPSNLYIQDAEIDKRFQILMRDVVHQAQLASKQYQQISSKISQVIDFRTKNKAILESSKNVTNLKFAVPQFIVKNIQLYEAIFSTIYYHPCYMIKIIQANQLNKFQLLKFIQVIYRNDIVDNNHNQSIILTLAIKAFQVEFYGSPNLLDYISELKLFKNSSIFLQIYIMFLKKDKEANEFFSSSALKILEEYFFNPVYSEYASQIKDSNTRVTEMQQFFNMHTQSQYTGFKYQILLNILHAYIALIIQKNKHAHLNQEQLLSVQLIYLHNQIINTIKEKVMDGEVERLSGLIGLSLDQKKEKIYRFEVHLDERIQHFMLHLYFGSITEYIFMLQQDRIQVAKEHHPFQDSEQNFRVINQTIDRFFQKDPQPPNQYNERLNHFINTRQSGPTNINLSNYITVYQFLSCPVQFSLENLHMQELIQDIFTIQERHLQIEIQDILFLQQFYCSQIWIRNKDAINELFVRRNLDPIFIILKHLQFREIQTKLFSTEILNRKMNLKIAPHPLLLQKQSKESPLLRLFKCDDCQVILPEIYISHTKQLALNKLMTDGWKCGRGHYNKLGVLDCESLGCSELITQEALKNSRVLQYYFRVKDEISENLVEIMTEMNTIQKGIDMFDHFTQLKNSNQVKKNVKLSNLIDKFYDCMIKANDKEKFESESAQLAAYRQRFSIHFRTYYDKATSELGERMKHRQLQLNYSNLIKNLEMMAAEKENDLGKLMQILTKQEVELKKKMKIQRQYSTQIFVLKPYVQPFGFYTSANMIQEQVLVKLTFQNKDLPKLTKNVKFYFLGQADGGWIIHLVYLKDDILNLFVPCIKFIYPIELSLYKIEIPIDQFLELRRMAKYRTQITFKSINTEVTFNILKLIEIFKFLDSRNIS